MKDEKSTTKATSTATTGASNAETPKEKKPAPALTVRSAHRRVMAALDRLPSDAERVKVLDGARALIGG